jgi:hypothetical protein
MLDSGPQYNHHGRRDFDGLSFTQTHRSTTLTASLVAFSRVEQSSFNVIMEGVNPSDAEKGQVRVSLPVFLTS